MSTFEMSASGAVELRAATEADAARLSELVHAAYGHYVERVGEPPRPMIDDYAEVVPDLPRNRRGARRRDRRADRSRHDHGGLRHRQRRRRSLPFAEKRYDSLPRLLGDRSFRDEHQIEFDNVQRLYRTRNSVVHAGELSYSEDGATHRIDQKIAYDFLLAAHEAAEWVHQL